MTKFRSKLKKKDGTKKVAKGQSSISNPGVTKYRAKAKSRFFQAGLAIRKYFLVICYIVLTLLIETILIYT